MGTAKVYWLNANYLLILKFEKSGHKWQIGNITIICTNLKTQTVNSPIKSMTNSHSQEKKKERTSIFRAAWGDRTYSVVLTEPLYLLEISHFLLLPVNEDGLSKTLPARYSSPCLPLLTSHCCHFLPHWYWAGLESPLKYIFLIGCVRYLKKHTLHTLCRDTFEIRNLVYNQYQVFNFFHEIPSFIIIRHFECVISPKRWRKCC